MLMTGGFGMAVAARRTDRVIHLAPPPELRKKSIQDLLARYAKPYVFAWR